MTIATRYPTSYNPLSGTWNNQTNAGADDNNVVSITRGTTKNSQDNLECTGFDFDSVIPSGATINQVDVEVEHRVASTSNVCFLENFLTVSGTDGAVNSDGSEPTTLTTQVYTSYARPGGGGWSRTDLLDANFKATLRARNGNNASSNTWEWDYIRVVVDYTAGQTFPQSLPATEISSPSFVKKAIKTVSVVESSLPGLANVLVFVKSLIAAEITLPTLSLIKTATKALSVVVVSINSLAKKTFKTLSIASVESVSLAAAKLFTKTITAIELSAASLVRVITRAQSLSAISGIVASISRALTYTRTLSVTGVATITFSLVLTLYRTLSTTASTVNSLVKGVLKSMSATEVASAVITTTKTILRSISVISISVVSVASVITEFVITFLFRATTILSTLLTRNTSTEEVLSSSVSVQGTVAKTAEINRETLDT